MHKKLKLKKQVKKVLYFIIIVILLVLSFNVLKDIDNKIKINDKKAIEYCIKQTNNKNYCERNYYGVN